MAAVVGPIAKDWENREIIEVVQLNVLQIAAFLNKFDTSVRSKLAVINGKLTKLERAIELCEAAAKVARSDATKTNNYAEEQDSDN